jgi:hypothetical protein
MIFSQDKNRRCDGKCFRLGLRRQVTAHFRFLRRTVRLRRLCGAFQAPAGMTASVLRSALIGAIANDACPGLMGEKQQKRNSPHQSPQGGFAGCELWFCSLPRQRYLLPTSCNQDKVLLPEPL